MNRHIADWLAEMPEVNIAAQWWADILRAGARHAPGGESPDEHLWAAMARRDIPPLTDDQIDRFQLQLALNMVSIWQSTWSQERPTDEKNRPLRLLSVDYEPNDILSRSAFFAGFAKEQLDLFPEKTIMWVNPGSVRVSYGYGAPIEELMKSIE